MKINHPVIFSVTKQSPNIKEIKENIWNLKIEFYFSFPAFSPQPNRILLTNKKQFKKKKWGRRIKHSF